MQALEGLSDSLSRADVSCFSFYYKDISVNRENHHFGARGIGLQILDFGFRNWGFAIRNFLPMLHALCFLKSTIFIGVVLPRGARHGQAVVLTLTLC